MKIIARAAPAMLAFGLLAACQHGPSGTEVTRFHTGQPIVAQPIQIEPVNDGDKDSLEYAAYGDVIAAELARHSFAPATMADVDLVARFDIREGSEYEPPRRSPVSLGVGAGSWGSNIGVSIGSIFGLGDRRGGEIYFTELSVQLQSRASGETVWEGTAVRETWPGEESRTAIVADLANALFQDFPGRSGETIIVE